MRWMVFSVHDQVADVWTNPMVDFNEATAERKFANSIEEPDHQFHRNPEDFALYCIGTYDDTSGELEGRMPEFVARGSSYVQVGDGSPVQPGAAGTDPSLELQ